jgi:ribonuclease PH
MRDCDQEMTLLYCSGEQAVWCGLVAKCEVAGLLGLAGTRAACINAASMALADAGIPMRDLVVSCAAGYLNSTPLLDLNYIEDSGGGPDLTVGIFPKLDKVSLLQMDSKLSTDLFEKVLTLAMEGSKAIAEYMRQVPSSHLPTHLPNQLASY